MFSTRQMFDNRLDVENALFKAVGERLGGTCCAKDCTSFSRGKCMKGSGFTNNTAAWCLGVSGVPVETFCHDLLCNQHEGLHKGCIMSI